MTRLDTAALHRWLTDAANQTRAERDSIDTTTDDAIAATDRAFVYRDIDGWLCSTAGHQLHEPGHDLNPDAYLASGQVEADLDELRTWILERAAATPIEARAKTYTAVANRLHQFAVAPDPFPHGDDTPGWGPPVPGWWPERLRMAWRAARDLVR